MYQHQLERKPEKKRKTQQWRASTGAPETGMDPGPESETGQRLLELQGRYGNRYVQGVVNAARRSEANAVIQKAKAAPEPRPNLTGLPDKLKAGAERLSGISMEAVRVHYNSAKPAQVQAFAYTEGSEIHLGPGQERHLPHEAWHVIQQAQGRVKPTLRLPDQVLVNDDRRLEREADRMGSQALRNTPDQGLAGDNARSGILAAMPPAGFANRLIIQRKQWIFGHDNRWHDLDDWETDPPKAIVFPAKNPNGKDWKPNDFWDDGMNETGEANSNASPIAESEGSSSTAALMTEAASSKTADSPKPSTSPKPSLLRKKTIAPKSKATTAPATTAAVEYEFVRDTPFDGAKANKDDYFRGQEVDWREIKGEFESQIATEEGCVAPKEHRYMRLDVQNAGKGIQNYQWQVGGKGMYVVKKGAKSKSSVTCVLFANDVDVNDPKFKAKMKEATRISFDEGIKVFVRRKTKESVSSTTSKAGPGKGEGGKKK